MLTDRLVKGRCTPTTHANRTKRRCTRPIKLQISYRLSIAARVSFLFERRVGGRLVD